MADYYSKHTGLSIDTAVDKAHAHDNKDILDLIKEFPAVQYSTHYDFPYEIITLDLGYRDARRL